MGFCGKMYRLPKYSSAAGEIREQATIREINKYPLLTCRQEQKAEKCKF
jgi:hypothetical protein